MAARHVGFVSWYEKNTGRYTAAASNIVQRLLGRGRAAVWISAAAPAFTSTRCLRLAGK